MGITNVVGRRGWSITALLVAVAAVGASCVDTSGSRADFGEGDDDSGMTASDGNGASSSGSSSGATPLESGSPADMGPATTPDACGFPSPPPPPAPSGTLYSGFPMGTAMGCASNIPAPRNGSWFQYHDSSDDGGSLIMSAMAELGGCGGMSLCAYHAKGPTNGAGFPGYGAGVGFDLNDDSANPPDALAYDAMAAGYTGIQFWAKGTITGTRGPGYSSSPQTIHLKLPTTTNRGGDDYGFYCQMIDPMTWTLCNVPFSKLIRDGFSATPNPATDMFDSQNVQKVQFEFSTYSTTGSVTMDAWIDEVSFY